MASKDQIGFDRWLQVNAVIASVFAVALLAMAVTSAAGLAPDRIMASLQTSSVATAQQAR